ncbi:MAG: hypothetical protein GXP62_12315, partial [Oligoflexia bacterium]|nr:hypothetical protein [Oligoflexia bacterium]
IFSGQPGARAWRRHISTHAFEKGAKATVITDALSTMDRAAEQVAERAKAWAADKARP